MGKKLIELNKIKNREFDKFTMTLESPYDCSSIAGRIEVVCFTMIQAVSSNKEFVQGIPGDPRTILLRTQLRLGLKLGLKARPGGTYGR